MIIRLYSRIDGMRPPRRDDQINSFVSATKQYLVTKQYLTCTSFCHRRSEIEQTTCNDNHF